MCHMKINFAVVRYTNAIFGLQIPLTDIGTYVDKTRILCNANDNRKQVFAV